MDPEMEALLALADPRLRADWGALSFVEQEQLMAQYEDYRQNG